MPAGLDSGVAFDAFARAVVTAARPFVGAVMIYGLGGPRQAAIASLQRASHASFGLRRSKTHCIDERAAQPA